MERKLASVRVINNIEPIPNADMIELVTVDGWKVVSKKGEFKVGDLCIYFEIDSFLPIRDEFEFLRKSSYKKMSDGSEGFRLKTIRLRGQISQGLVLPLFIINENTDIKINSFWDGMDVTEMLGVKKYEPPIPAELSGKVKGYFPSFLRKTDEERIQNLADEYNELKKHTYYVTEKLDGSSATFYYNEGVFGVCSRNLELLETDENTFWRVAREMEIEERLRSFGKNIAIQGELIGEGIQKNPYKIKGQTIKFFNAFDIDKYEYFSFDEFEDFILYKLQLEIVPIIAVNFKLPETIDELIQMSDGNSILNSNTNREGVVIRTMDRKTSFKVISNKYLLKHDN